MICNAKLETLDHFCFRCEIVSLFWNDVTLISASFDIKDVLFGIVHTVNNVLINYIIFERKYLIIYLFTVLSSTNPPLH